MLPRRLPVGAIASFEPGASEFRLFCTARSPRPRNTCRVCSGCDRDKAVYEGPERRTHDEVEAAAAVECAQTLWTLAQADGPPVEACRLQAQPHLAESVGDDARECVDPCSVPIRHRIIGLSALCEHGLHALLLAATKST